MKIIVTGGAGFIGSAVIRHLIDTTDADIVNVDKLTYASNLASMAVVSDNPRYRFEKLDICDAQAMVDLFANVQPTHVMHLAAESHVDRSISGSRAFIETNILGTYNLLEAARGYWQSLEPSARDDFRFHHISTDEVYGSLGADGLFEETTPYDPSSPYSSSKAASDHLVTAWYRTYGLPIVLSNCSNNYGPYQYPEKLIPLLLLNALSGKNMPIYGDGMNVRDWLHVEDHCRGIEACLDKGKPGETYNIGGGAELPNMEVIDAICREVDRAFEEFEGLADRYPDAPAAKGEKSESLKTYVTDRAGHDRRYAIDERKARAELEYAPERGFDEGLRQTLRWYLDREDWWKPLLA